MTQQCALAVWTGLTPCRRHIFYQALQTDGHERSPTYLHSNPSVWEAGGRRRMRQGKSKKAHLPRQEWVQECSLLRTACANRAAKRTFCLVAAPGQGGVLLCDRRHLQMESRRGCPLCDGLPWALSPNSLYHQPTVNADKSKPV